VDLGAHRCIADNGAGETALRWRMKNPSQSKNQLLQLLPPVSASSCVWAASAEDFASVQDIPREKDAEWSGLFGFLRLVLHRWRVPVTIHACCSRLYFDYTRHCTNA
jgi:hypothetical protein